MKIIKPGNPKAILDVRTFACETCGCVFEAERGEYDYGNQFVDGPWCKCPCCENIAFEKED